MRRLLNANFSRLWKNKIFWTEIGLTAILSVFIMISNYIPGNSLAGIDRLYLEDVFFIMYLFLGFILCAGISLIVGTEYSDGTIRNKLIVGRTRAQIYFAHLITSIVSSCVILLTHGIITFGAGYFLWGNFQMETKQVAVVLLSALLTTFVFSALFVAISMNCTNRAVAAVASLLLVLGLTTLTGTIMRALSEAETLILNVQFRDGEMLYDEVQNPAYVSGLQRIMYEFVYDLLPTGQLMQMYRLDFERCARWPIFSVVFFILITAVGYFMFRKKAIR